MEFGKLQPLWFRIERNYINEELIQERVDDGSFALVMDTMPQTAQQGHEKARLKLFSKEQGCAGLCQKKKPEDWKEPAPPPRRSDWSNSANGSWSNSANGPWSSSANGSSPGNGKWSSSANGSETKRPLLRPAPGHGNRGRESTDEEYSSRWHSKDPSLPWRRSRSRQKREPSLQRNKQNRAPQLRGRSALREDDLPPGWELRFSETYKRSYYWNPKDQISSWKKP